MASSDNKTSSKTKAGTLGAIQTSSDYIVDPEYISKVINHFIFNDEVNQTATTARKPATGKQHYNREHVIQALSSLQLSYRPKYIPGQKTNINTDAFKSALMNSMAKLDNVAIPKSMNQIDSKTINFVEMIFGAFLRDKNVSDAIKELLLLMQIPIIKVALLDNKFFNNEKHPARHVLNSIAHLGIGIEDKENKVYQTMQYIIEQLLQSFVENMDVFQTAKLSFDRLSNIEKSKHATTEKQTRQLITMEYTRQLVLKELKFYTMGITIPPSLQPLILSHWATLMYQRFINFGKDSIEWREAVGILRLLVKTLSPIHSKEDWLALRSIYKGIVNSVRSCLNDSRQNKEKAFIATSNLNNYYTNKIKDSKFYIENSSEDADAPADVMSNYNLGTLFDFEQAPIHEESDPTQNIIDNMPEFIKPNNWFEVFTDYSHPVRRLKLSVIMKEHAKLAFVDYMGNKVIEKDIEQFITELKNDQSRQINDHSIFEYALSMVIISIAARS